MSSDRAKNDKRPLAHRAQNCYRQGLQGSAQAIALHNSEMPRICPWITAPSRRASERPSLPAVPGRQFVHVIVDDLGVIAGKRAALS